MLHDAGGVTIVMRFLDSSLRLIHPVKKQNLNRQFD